SRRRHTRFSRDWSSDVCSSDLQIATSTYATRYSNCNRVGVVAQPCTSSRLNRNELVLLFSFNAQAGVPTKPLMFSEPSIGATWRSEERRVGKEAGAGW